MTLECYDCLKEKLADVESILISLDALSSAIGIKKSSPPCVFKYDGRFPDEWGISGIVAADGAHISIHTFPEGDHASINIFSRRDFDAERVCSEWIVALKARRHEVVVHSQSSLECQDVEEQSQPRVYH